MRGCSEHSFYDGRYTVVDGGENLMVGAHNSLLMAT